MLHRIDGQTVQVISHTQYYGGAYHQFKVDFLLSPEHRLYMTNTPIEKIVAIDYEIDLDNGKSLKFYLNVRIRTTREGKCIAHIDTSRTNFQSRSTFPCASCGKLDSWR